MIDWVQLLEKKESKHKVFISYYHNDDQAYRNDFERRFGRLFISKSVEPGDIDSDLDTEYIKKIIQKNYISNSSVLIVLLGPKTYCRKHVDWEISAALNKKVGGYSGLMGILLPTFPLSSDGKYSFSAIPARLADNVKSGYAKVYTWNSFFNNSEFLKSAIQDAFDGRISLANKTDNSRIQLKKNLCG